MSKKFKIFLVISSLFLAVGSVLLNDSTVSASSLIIASSDTYYSRTYTQDMGDRIWVTYGPYAGYIYRVKSSFRSYQYDGVLRRGPYVPLGVPEKEDSK